MAGPRSRFILHSSLQYRTYVLIVLSAVFKLFLAIDPYRIALYPITRLVAVSVTKINGNRSQLRPKPEIVLRNLMEEGLTGPDLVILPVQIELPSDCMRIQYKIGPCVRMWTPCSCGICLDERILNRYSKPNKPLAIVRVAQTPGTPRSFLSRHLNRTVTRPM